jgi:hypothetical protein
MESLLWCVLASAVVVLGVVVFVKVLLAITPSPPAPAAQVSDEAQLVANWRGRCTTCNRAVAAGDDIFWHKHRRTVRHVNCTLGQQRAMSALVASTLERLESAKGPAARRNALAQALTEIPAGPDRQRLLLEASRIEVDAVLTKVDGLKTASAKRRHLEAALTALKADDLPDELQAEEQRWLEDALAELDQK